MRTEETKTKTLVVGATGYLGRPFFDAAKRISVAVGTSSRREEGCVELDLENHSAFDYGMIKPGTYVFLLAAISAPDICAEKFEWAWSINVTGTLKFIERALERGARVIFFSSDTVYGENSEQFDESSLCNPAGEYAEMKRAVEEYFSGNSEFKSIRLSYVFSRQDKFTKYLISCAENKNKAELFHPFFRSVIHRDDVIHGALALTKKWDEVNSQVINFGGPDVISRVDMARCMKEIAIPNLDFHVTEPEVDFFKKRPRYIAMRSPILPSLLGRIPRCFADAARVEFCIDKYKA